MHNYMDALLQTMRTQGRAIELLGPAWSALDLRCRLDAQLALVRYFFEKEGPDFKAMTFRAPEVVVTIGKEGIPGGVAIHAEELNRPRRSLLLIAPNPDFNTANRRTVISGQEFLDLGAWLLEQEGEARPSLPFRFPTSASGYDRHTVRVYRYRGF